MLSNGGILDVILSEAKHQREAISFAQARMTSVNRLRLHNRRRRRERFAASLVDLVYPVSIGAVGRPSVNSHDAASAGRHEKEIFGPLSNLLAAHRTFPDSEHNVTSVLP
jgi:hypothetical protein